MQTDEKLLNVWRISIAEGENGEYRASSRQITKDEPELHVHPPHSNSGPLVVTMDLWKIHEKTPWGKRKLAVDITAGWTQKDEMFKTRLPDDGNWHSNCGDKGFMLLHTFYCHEEWLCPKPIWLPGKKEADEAIATFAPKRTEEGPMPLLCILGLNRPPHLYCLLMSEYWSGTISLYRHVAETVASQGNNFSPDLSLTLEKNTC